MTWDELFEIEYGTPLNELGVVVQRVLRRCYHKIAPHKFIFAYADDAHDETLRYCGFVWAASDGAALRVLTADAAADDLAIVAPPTPLLPKNGIWSYAQIVQHGRTVAPTNFYDVVRGHRIVHFAEFSYFYRSELPPEDEPPIAIAVDLRR